MSTLHSETLSTQGTPSFDKIFVLAQWLEQHPLVESVIYPGNEISTHENSDHSRALSFVIRGNKEHAVKFAASVTQPNDVTGTDKTKTLVIHAATLAQPSPAGVAPTLLHVSPGIEHIEEIKANFQEAFEKVFQGELV